MKLLLIGLLVILPLILPFFNSGFFKVHDFTHTTRLAELNQTILDGQIPARWSKNLGFGFGIPLFSFYAPLPYMIGVLLHWNGLPLLLVMKTLFLISYVGSFFAMYYLAREFFKPPASFIAGLLFLYVPYRAVDVYVRGALGELWGIMFIVLSLLCMVRLLKRPTKQRIGITGLSIAGLLLSHNLMTIVGIPMIVFYALLNSAKKLVMPIVFSILLGFGLASYFFVPAVLEKSYTSVDQLTSGSGQYSHHFVYLKQLIASPFGYGGSIEGPHDGISFEIGIVHLVLSGLAAFLLLRSRKQEVAFTTRMIIFCLVALGGSIFLMSFHSQFVWDLIPVLRYLQFPWRLLVVPLIVTPLLAAYVLEKTFNWKLPVGIISSILIFIVVGVLYQPLNKPNTEGVDEAIYSTDTDYIRNFMSTVIPDYIHPQMSHIVMAATKDISPANERFELKGAGLLQVMHDKTGYVKVQVQSNETTTFTANIFDFPGWEWTVHGDYQAHSVDSPLPTMSLQLEPGIHVIEGRLKETPLRLVTDIVSLGSIVVLLGLAYEHRRNQT